MKTKHFQFFSAFCVLIVLCILYGGGCSGTTESLTYYTVTFNSDGGTSVSSQTVESGKTATEPTAPTKDGYTFLGWYLNNTAFDFSAVITSDITLTAKWTASTNTFYTVKHLLQNVALNDYELDSTENLTGTTGESTSASAKTYAGFTAQEITQKTIAADGSTVVSIYYDRNTITLTLDLNGGSGTESLSGKYGTSFTAPENPTKTGYTFSEWSPELPSTFPAEDTTYTATWIDTGSISYTVKHFLQNLELTGYKEQSDDRQILTGTAGNTTLATAKTYAGFTAQEITQSTIAEDGSTVVSIYYDRNTITLTFDTDGGTSIDSISGIYESSVTPPSEPTRNGYTFSNWSPEIPETFPAENTTYTAIWEDGEPSTYTVKHFLQNIELDSYDENVSDRQTFTWAAGNTTSATAKTYAGFTAQEITQKTIVADGSTVVSIYYDRNTITLTFDTDGGSSIDSISGKYGTAVTAPENPTKDRYTFVGWSPEIPETFPAEDTTYTAQWKDSFSITASAPTYTSNVDDLLSVDTSDSSKITFTAQSGYSSYSWYVDGELQSETGTTFTMNIDNYSKGYYTVMLIVDSKYSTTVEVAVSK